MVEDNAKVNATTPLKHSFFEKIGRVKISRIGVHELLTQFFVYCVYD